MTKNIKIKLLNFLVLIPLYYIVGKKSIFLYVLSLSLYNIFLSCLEHITIKECLQKVYYNYSRNKIYKLSILIIGVSTLVFTLLGIILSNIMENILGINNTFLVFLFMGFSSLTEPIVKISLEYLETFNLKKLSKLLFNSYYYVEMILLLIISLLVFRLANIPFEIANACLYLPKLLSTSIILVVVYLIIKSKDIEFSKKREENKVNYLEEIKKIFKNVNLPLVIKNIYYYTSIVILYLVLSKRYSYMLKESANIISFVYLYINTFINLVIEFVMIFINYFNKENNPLNKIYLVFDRFLSLAIIISIISPLIIKVIFNNPNYSIYLLMFGFLSIFIALYNITFKYIKDNKILNISLISGIITKLVLIVPLIDAFYRMGYNLVYGDIISTIAGLFISIIINYIYLKKSLYATGYLEKILKSLYENIILCIVLVLFEFLIPITTNSYIKSLGLLMAYISLSIMILNIQKKKEVIK